MIGFGAYVLRSIGAFVRWAFTGFKGSFMNIYENPKTDMKLGFENDVLNIFISLLVLAIIVIIINEIIM